MADLITNMEKGVALKLASLVELEPGRKNSLTLSRTEGTKMTLFAIDKGEGLSTHSASGDALVYVLEGVARIGLDGKETLVHAGEAIVMPQHIPHSVHAEEAFKMLLVVVL